MLILGSGETYQLVKLVDVRVTVEVRLKGFDLVLSQCLWDGVLV
jgi:hypothetical protein